MLTFWPIIKVGNDLPRGHLLPSLSFPATRCRCHKSQSHWPPPARSKRVCLSPDSAHQLGQSSRQDSVSPGGLGLHYKDCHEFKCKCEVSPAKNNLALRYPSLKNRRKILFGNTSRLQTPRRVRFSILGPPACLVPPRYSPSSPEKSCTAPSGFSRGEVTG